jgi:hypothetical protein
MFSLSFPTLWDRKTFGSMQTSNSQAFDACLAEALSHMREWVPHWLFKLHEALQEREMTASHVQEKLLFVQARQHLESHRDLVAVRFIEAFAASLQENQSLPAAHGPHVRSLSSVSFEELELMGDEQVQETVEFARVLQVIKIASDEALVAFNARLSRAQGWDRIRAETNPLRPDAVVTVLNKTLTELRLDTAVRTRWLQTGALALGRELSHAYTRLSTLLDGFGIVPAGFHVIQTAQGRQSALGGLAPGMAQTALPALHAEAVPQGTVLSNDALLTLGHLHQLLVGNLQNAAEQASTLDPAARTMSSNMVRTLAAEVVTLMLRSIAEDGRLLAPLRLLLAGMKPALLQLARSDPRFFADRDNPARQLLDRVTERSLAFTSEQSPGYEVFVQQVRGIVQALNAPGADLAARFPVLLEALNRAPTPATAPAQVQARGLAVQTLVRVEQRNLLAERVVSEIAARNDFERAPAFMRDFLTGPWAQVVAQARIEAAAQSGATGTPPAVGSQAMRYMEILPDLLWSTQVALVSRNRARLLKVIPDVLQTLRAGLVTIDYPREPKETFFKALMALHMAAHKTMRADSRLDDSRLDSRAAPAPLSSLMPSDSAYATKKNSADHDNAAKASEPHDPVMNSGQDPGAQAASGQPAQHGQRRQFEVHPEPWLQPMEARNSGFMVDLDEKTVFAEPSSQQRDWSEIKADIDKTETQYVQALPVGTWVDVWQDGQAMRCQITWVSPHGTMFILTATDGRSISMTRRSLDRLREKNRLQVVADQGMVDTALDAVARQAWINSSKP